ncbi:hypothetical protein GIX45_25635 [Erwinia sp. CPCC 100877]|nr:hypothetical protein [Erwinia sp. CPCC 100877]
MIFFQNTLFVSKHKEKTKMKKIISATIISCLLLVPLFPLITHAEEHTKSGLTSELPGSTSTSRSAVEEQPADSKATVTVDSTETTEPVAEQQAAELPQTTEAPALASNEGTSVQPRAELVPIPDLTLRQLINTKLGHSTDWATYTPTKQELASISGIFRLDFNTMNKTQFTSLEGLQYLTGISELYAYYVEFLNLDDLNLISQLTQLTYISMGATNVTNVEFARSLPNLTGMVFRGNHISDVSASLDYYNSSKRKQYNFIGQSLSKEVTLAPGQTTVEPIKVIGVNGNSAAIVTTTWDSHFTLENGQFVGHNLQPGQSYLISYNFEDKSINHAGRLTGEANIKVIVPQIAGVDVTVKYVDEIGTDLATPQVLSGNVGDPYTSVEAVIPGYTLQEVQGNPTGNFTDQAQTIVYLYKKVIVPHILPPTNDLTNDPTHSTPGNEQAKTEKTASVTLQQQVSKEQDKTESKKGSVIKPSLPKTGEKQHNSQLLSLIGIGLVSVLSSSFIWKSRRIKNN